MTARSALYVGSVIHRRLRPRPHRLRYRVFWMLLDLDEIEGLAARLRLFSSNRFNLVSFHDRDHGDGSARPLRAQITAKLVEAGVAFDGGRLMLFCMPRVFGYGFNPLSVWFCYRRDGSLAAILYDVHNTFGERHTYVKAVAPGNEAVVHQQAQKVFHVSPFLGMDMGYTFRVAPPEDRVSVAIRGEDDDGPLIVASLAGDRVELSDRALLRQLAIHPLLTLKVIAAIHWHALRMLLKGFRIYPNPSRRKPSSTSTLTPAE